MPLCPLLLSKFCQLPHVYHACIQSPTYIYILLPVVAFTTSITQDLLLVGRLTRRCVGAGDKRPGWQRGGTCTAAAAADAGRRRRAHQLRAPRDCRRHGYLHAALCKLPIMLHALSLCAAASSLAWRLSCIAAGRSVMRASPSLSLWLHCVCSALLKCLQTQ